MHFCEGTLVACQLYSFWAARSAKGNSAFSSIGVADVGSSAHQLRWLQLAGCQAQEQLAAGRAAPLALLQPGLQAPMHRAPASAGTHPQHLEVGQGEPLCLLAWLLLQAGLPLTPQFLEAD